ncbi:tetratricopeptide repeat protein [Nocardia sp. NPDC051570]|uniref:tetratricopeptide repeat protein n=1 Tax=Nocardia sp. NPDC051570 TaxID=3364324 RepID=UPI003795C421
MGVGLENDSPRALFVARLAELWTAAGNPTLQRVADATETRMRATRASSRGGGSSAQRISDWRTGRNVPSRYEAFEPVLVTLIRLAAAAPGPVPSVLSNRSAWRRLWKEATAEPVSSRPMVTTALRRDIDTFVGRERELERILEAAGPGRVVSIHTVDGMPGVGKTALVTRAAHLLSERFPGGRFFVELHGYTPGQAPADPFDVLATLLTDLGIAPGHIPDSLEARRDLWRDRLSDRRALLVLDDARDHAQIEPLLPTGPGCLTLITSRRRLVALDGALPLTLDTLDPDHAIELFYRLAHRDPSGSDATAVAEIVRLCGYLPLAIVLLAGRLAHHPSWTIQTLADQFTTATDRLTELDSGDRAVYAAFTMSYRDLSPERARLFRYLGLHPGPDTDTVAVAALADLPAAVTRRELEALYTDHLIEEPAPGRYRLHDLLRDYAHTLAASDPPEENDRALDRLLDYYQNSAAAADRHLSRHARPTPPPASSAGVAVRDFDDEVRALAWMRVERINLLACVEHAAADRPRRVVDLTGALAGLLDRDGPWLQARHLHRRAAVTAGSLDDHLGEATALADLGSIGERTGDYAEATDLHQQALARYREVGSRLGEANVLNNLGVVREATGDYPEATTLHQRALDLHREIGNRRGQANTLMFLGRARFRTGDYAEATDLHRRALAIFREIGNRLGEANVLGNLGLVCMGTGEYAEAADLSQRALNLYREIGNRLGEANSLLDLGTVRKEAGVYAEATDLNQRALAIFREIGNRLGEANILGNLGLVRTGTGDYAEATDLHRQALAIFREIGYRLGEANTLNNLGIVRYRTEDYAEAADLHRQALALFREIGNRLGEADALNGIGYVLIKSGELRDALGVFADALGLARRIHSQFQQAAALEGAARCRAGLGDTDTAVTQLREAVEIYRRIGAPETGPASAYLATLESAPPPSP